MYVRELRAVYRRRRVPRQADWPTRLSCGPEVGRAFQQLLGDQSVEVCGMFCLSVRLDVLTYHELSRGTLDATLVHPRGVFKIALLANARVVVVGTTTHPATQPRAPMTSP